MSSQQLDEEAIVEVAREIQNPAIRAKYLSQVCHDERQLGRLEGRLMTGRRWQFSLRTLLVVMLLGGAMSAGIAGISVQAARARRAEAEAKALAIEARQMAEVARDEAEAARQRAAELSGVEETTP